MVDIERLASEVIASVQAFVGRALAPIRKELADLVQTAAALDKRLDAIPAPEKGDAGASAFQIACLGGFSGSEGEWLESLKGRNGIDGQNGKDGADGTDGRDGRDGQHGVKGDDGKDGRDGINGKDGIDGMGFDDLSVEYDGERTFTFKLEQGERIKSFSFKVPLVLDRGVFKPDTEYEKGDGVTCGGSWHIALKDAPSGRPGLGGDWRLAVKRGQDGRDGKLVEESGKKIVRLV